MPTQHQLLVAQQYRNKSKVKEQAEKKAASTPTPGTPTPAPPPFCFGESAAQASFDFGYARPASQGQLPLPYTHNITEGVFKTPTPPPPPHPMENSTITEDLEQYHVSTPAPQPQSNEYNSVNSEGSSNTDQETTAQNLDYLIDTKIAAKMSELKTDLTKTLNAGLKGQSEAIHNALNARFEVQNTTITNTFNTFNIKHEEIVKKLEDAANNFSDVPSTPPANNTDASKAISIQEALISNLQTDKSLLQANNLTLQAKNDQLALDIKKVQDELKAINERRITEGQHFMHARMIAAENAKKIHELSFFKHEIHAFFMRYLGGGEFDWSGLYRLFGGADMDAFRAAGETEVVHADVHTGDGKAEKGAASTGVAADGKVGVEVPVNKIHRGGPGSGFCAVM